MGYELKHYFVLFGYRGIDSSGIEILFVVESDIGLKIFLPET